MLSVKIVGVEEFDYQSCARFSTLIAMSGDVIKPRARALAWVMRLIEDSYDARFAHEKMEVEREDDISTADPLLSTFPIFVVRQLCTLVGLKNLVDQTCWDLLYNANKYRTDYLEVEIFMRFLQEFYDQDDLLFFLYVRSVVAKTLHISFKRRWAKSEGAGRPAKALWMSYREIALVSKTVFGIENSMSFFSLSFFPSSLLFSFINNYHYFLGTTNEAFHRNFMAIVATQVVGQKTEEQVHSNLCHIKQIKYHQKITLPFLRFFALSSSVFLPSLAF
jgi:hypothetical protein